MRYLNYEKGEGKEAGWIVEESAFDSGCLGKCEAIFCQGNGYLGLRAALEEEYVGECRNMFVTGTFDKFGDNEVTELPNLPDITKMAIFINGRRFSMDKGIVKDYSRKIDLRNGELVRSFDWESPRGEAVRFLFRRMVSMDQEHLIGSRVEIRALSQDVEIVLESGIDGTAANSGSQHFLEGSKRVYENRYMEMFSETVQSKVLVAIHSAHRITADGRPAQPESLPVIGRRCIRMKYSLKLSKESSLCVEKITAVHTSRDLAYAQMEEEQAREALRENAKKEALPLLDRGYQSLLEESGRKWEEIWKAQEVSVKSKRPFDQLALRFAIYHLNIMVKKDDSRVGIGAKALSGEGYKGHSFWDTEVFILPYFMMTEPGTARTLLEYRYKTLCGARAKARENGFEGAMYPWESAWFDDGEVTPLWGAADVVTGETLAILTGLIEQHITADIAYAVGQYYSITGDVDFMERYGYEMILDTAKFWTSRWEWKEERRRYEITDVIGPDEYKEHVDNDVYTNYLAFYNMKLARRFLLELNADHKGVYDALNEKMNLGGLLARIEEMLPKLYLPAADRKTGIIPQFDGYFDLEKLDLKKYKESSVVGTIFDDYNAEQINRFQVLKQSDLVILFYLLDDLFDSETKKRNYAYYEERTLHDSSLSKSTHSVIANDLGMTRAAYEFFQGAAAIDLGEEMKSSDAGIHSASMGGIWQSAVFGFGGVRIVDEMLRISPHLPGEWTELSYPLIWRGSPLKVTVSGTRVRVENRGAAITLLLAGKETTIEQGGEAEAEWIKNQEEI